MTFDAGAIEATLKLNRDQFDEELDAAEQRARDFEGKSYSAKLKVETGEADADLTSTEALYEALRENLSRSIHIDVKADTAKADAELEVTSLEADKLERKRINIGSWFGGGGGIGNIISQIGGLGDAFGKMGSNISEGETVATPLFSGISCRSSTPCRNYGWSRGRSCRCGCINRLSRDYRNPAHVEDDAGLPSPRTSTIAIRRSDHFRSASVGPSGRGQGNLEPDRK